MRRHVLIFLLAMLSAGPLAAQQNGDAFGEKVRAYILANPEVILEAMEVLAQRDAAVEMASRIESAGEPVFDLTHAVTLGSPDATYKIVELFDYKCAVCKSGHPVLEAFVADNPDVAIEVQQLPILGPQSDRAARAFHAVFDLAGKSAAQTLHARLFHYEGAIGMGALANMLAELGHDPQAVEAAMYSDAVTSRINRIKDAALELGVVGTPVFVTERAVHQGIAAPDVLAELLAGLKGQ